MEEVWKPVIEKYKISNLGNVSKNDVIIKGSITNRGYKYFQLQRDGKRINFLYHQLVAKEFIGERPLNYDIDHINRNKLDNRLENLRYVSHKENMKNQDRYNKDADRFPCGRIRTPSKATGKIRKRGEGQLYQRSNGSWRAVKSINKIKYDKTFHTKEEAEVYLTNI